MMIVWSLEEITKGTDQTNAVDATTRATKLAELDQQILDLGRAEEASVRWLRDNMMVMDRRPRCDVFAVCGLKVHPRKKLSLVA
jgi:hypothetical protein